MTLPVVIVTTAAAATAFLIYQLLSLLVLSPLSRIPGPKLFALTKWRLAYEDYKGTRTRTLHAFHERYGPAVRIGPREVSFKSTSALKTIYGAGSSFERTEFYRMFEVYGRKNMFTFAGTREHAARKKMFAHAYAKSMMLKGKNATIIEKNVRLYLELIEREQASEIFSSLHYFSMETITEFLYGKSGKTFSLEGSRDHRALINDIVDPARRKYTWFVVHMPRFTGWLYSQTGFFSHMLRGFLPMQTPTTYTGARAHAMTACQTYASASTEIEGKDFALIAKLWEHHYTKKGGKLDDVDIAAECADHLLAGIDTTSDTLMFLIWSLSRPEHRGIQEKLRNEVRALSNDSLNAEGIPNVEVADKLPFVNAVIKETLRLFSPLPASEPRTSQIPTVIEGYTIPARTVVSVSPYSLHRNSEVFAEPLKFNPDRWLDPCENIAEMNRWFWAFSSGGRMCIGLNLAMAEMTTLVAALYRKYATTTTAGFDVMSPGVTSRFEMLYDENCSGVREHQCQIKFMAVP